jgi:hypothetical protein
MEISTFKQHSLLSFHFRAGTHLGTYKCSVLTS